MKKPPRKSMTVTLRGIWLYHGRRAIMLMPMIAHRLGSGRYRLTRSRRGAFSIKRDFGAGIGFLVGPPRSFPTGVGRVCLGGFRSFTGWPVTARFDVKRLEAK